MPVKDSGPYFVRDNWHMDATGLELVRKAAAAAGES
jgi:hypothetical protein